MNRSAKVLLATSLSLLATACGFDTVSESSQTGQVDSALDITLPAVDIPATGTASPGFKPVDDAIRRFMRERCVGAAVIGISYNGTVLHNRGYGYKNGPPNSACANASDPFVGGELMGAADPIRVGSNSKAVLSAVFRKEIKKALSAKRGGIPVTDQDIQNLKLINNGELELVAPRVRDAMMAGVGGDPGDITDEYCVPNAWSMVTIGQLLTHTAGLGGSETAYDELADIRALNSSLKVAVQQSQSGAPQAARDALKATYGQNAYFVPTANLEETAVAQGNRCFTYAPGTGGSVYSNGGFTLLNYVLEYVTQRPFVAPQGSPDSHYASLLSEFGAAEFGYGDGIEHSQTALGMRDVEEPQYRSWNEDQSTFYFVEKDEKRPWCVFDGVTCDFTKFRQGYGRYNWNWVGEKVNFTYSSNSVSPGVGALAVEAPKYLAFMNKFTVGGPYGGERSLYPGFHQHWGGMGGAVSWVAQMGGGTVNYHDFGDNRDGTMNFSSAVDDHCVLPKGVDVIFTMNQNNDPKCTKENGCVVCQDEKCSKTKTAFSDDVYDSVIKEALCKSDWTM
jgi:hypothetical protein